MKKVTFLLFASLSLFILFSGVVYAAELCIDPATGILNDNVESFIAKGDGLVPCGQTPKAGGGLDCRCELGHLLVMGVKIYKFITLIATAIAALLIAIGGVMLVISAGNPGWANRGKDLIKWAIIAILLIFSSWLIINVLLIAIGYSNSSAPWYQLPI